MTWKQTPANQSYNRRIWEEELASFVPERIFDVHTHIADEGTIPDGGTLSCAGHPIHAYTAPELLADLAAAVRLGDFGVLGASLLSMDYGTFYGTRVSNNAEGYEETGTFSPKAYAIGIAFAQKVSERFSYGVQVKYASQNLGSAWVGPTGGSLDDPNLAISQRKYSQGDFALDVGAFRISCR